jgi:hypothetical protein
MFLLTFFKGIGTHMLTSIKIVIATVIGSVAVASHASAATVSATTSEPQTVEGQDFALSLAGLAPSDGTGGTFSLYARGDYQDNENFYMTEFLDLDLEGLFSAGPIGAFNSDNGNPGLGGPFDLFNEYSTNTDVDFQRTFALEGALLDTLLADGQLDAMISLSDDVGLFGPSPQVGITLTYSTAMAAVPLPASLPLLLGGFAGFGLMRRRKKD